MKNIFTSLTKPVAKMSHNVGFWAKKNSPELLIAGSILAAAGSVFLAVKATLKVEPVIKKANNDITTIKVKMKDNDKLASGEYTLPALKKELTLAYSKTALELTKLYIPSAISFGLFLAGVLSSHKIMKSRNFALASAYSIMETSYKNYRERVKSKVGEKVEDEIYRNLKTEQVTVTEIDEDGNEVEVTRTIQTPQYDENELYSYCFDESNSNWEKNTMLNLELLLGRQKYLNQKLVSQGYLFLHDVYDYLGVYPGQIDNRKLQASKILGWIYDTTDPDHKGDNWVSFGISDAMGNLTPEVMDLVRAGQRNFWLEFNPDGDILTGTGDKKTFMHYAKN